MAVADTLAESAAKGDPSLYLDTNVLVDIVRPQRRPASTQILEAWRAYSWTCASSYFGLMEALDVEQESMWFRSMIRRGQDVDWLLRQRRARHLTRQARAHVESTFYRRFVADVQDYVQWLSLDERGWEEAIRLAMESDISAPDSIHVATAITHRCAVLVTSDDALRHAASKEIAVAAPEDVLSWLQTRAAAGESAP